MSFVQKMEAIDSKIIDFIKDHHVLTLATCVDNEPYCSSMFYAYVESESCFVFTSDTKTTHVQQVLQNSRVAGSIILETETIGKIQGLQFKGVMRELQGMAKLKYTAVYLKRFPYVVLKGSPLWVFEMTFAKLTDNRLGFGKKIIWEKTE